jgi:hypothetical protein
LPFDVAVKECAEGVTASNCGLNRISKDEPAMTSPLKVLLDRLDAIGDEHGELFDSDVREAMGNAIMEGFVRHQLDYAVPEDFCMFSEDGTAAVRDAIADFVSSANAQADGLNLKSFHDRLSFLQDDTVRSAAGNDYEEFLGHTPPEFYDEIGNVIRLQ